jgi:hypothetical protein
VEVLQVGCSNAVLIESATRVSIYCRLQVLLVADVCHGQKKSDEITDAEKPKVNRATDEPCNWGNRRFSNSPNTTPTIRTKTQRTKSPEIALIAKMFEDDCILTYPSSRVGLKQHHGVVGRWGRDFSSSSLSLDHNYLVY